MIIPDKDLYHCTELDLDGKDILLSQQLQLGLVTAVQDNDFQPPPDRVRRRIYGLADAKRCSLPSVHVPESSNYTFSRWSWPVAVPGVLCAWSGVSSALPTHTACSACQHGNTPDFYCLPIPHTNETRPCHLMAKELSPAQRPLETVRGPASKAVLLPASSALIRSQSYRTTYARWIIPALYPNHAVLLGKVPGEHSTLSRGWIKARPFRGWLRHHHQNWQPGAALPPETAALAKEVQTSRCRSHLSRCTVVSMPAGSGTYISEILPMRTISVRPGVWSATDAQLVAWKSTTLMRNLQVNRNYGLSRSATERYIIGLYRLPTVFKLPQW